MLKNKTKKHHFVEILYIVGILTIITLLIFLPEKAMRFFTQGILIWATKVLPALLPFFILTKLLSYTTFTNSVGKFLTPITNNLYRVGGVSGYIYIMSIMSGYPVGAKLTADFYNSGNISAKEAVTITSFTSTSGPLFIIGTVGVGLFESKDLGILILLSHYIGAIINGLVYRNTHTTSIQTTQKLKSYNPLNESMSGSIISIMVVGGFIALFYMILQIVLDTNILNPILNIFSIFNIQPEIIASILSGFVEVTTGATMLSKCLLSTNTSAILLSFLISFGGLSIHAQAFCFLKDFNMPYYKFLIQKITHAIISTSVTFLILLIY